MDALQFYELNAVVILPDALFSSRPSIDYPTYSALTLLDFAQVRRAGEAFAFGQCKQPVVVNSVETAEQRPRETHATIVAIFMTCLPKDQILKFELHVFLNGVKSVQPPSHR